MVKLNYRRNEGSMSEIINYTTYGTCSRQINVEIENDIIKDVEFIGGCNGNLKGIRSLIIGMNINDVRAKLRGIMCGSKPTSCPDQLAICLEEYIKEKSKEKTNV